MMIVIRAPFLLIMLMLIALIAHAQESKELSLYEQLCMVNKEWKTNHFDIGSLSEIIDFDSDIELIQAHFRLVERQLRRKDVDHLSNELRNARIQNLDNLNKYWTAGEFPLNRDFKERRPYFIDQDNTLCAVAHLLIEGGNEDLAMKISQETNNALIREMPQPELIDWVGSSGLTLNEVALIQPSYHPGPCYALFSIEGTYNYYYYPNNIYSCDSIYLENKTLACDGVPLNWLWDFGDGSLLSTEKNPVHKYEKAGQYWITLVAYNELGVSAWSDVVYIVFEDTAAESSFSYSSSYLEVDFVNKSNYADSYLWSFGDEVTGFTKNPTHVYADAGTYEVCLIASNSCNSDTFCDLVMVSCLDPISSFSYESANMEVSFTNTSLYNVSTYFWDFGDGSTSSEKNPIHKYDLEGNYQVCLKAGNQCDEDIYCDLVTVSCPDPNSSFSYESQNMEVSFSNSSLNADTFSWDLGDGSTSSEKNPTHNYEIEGKYQVCLTAGNQCDEDVYCDLVSVSCPKPVSEFRHVASLLNTLRNQLTIFGILETVLPLQPKVRCISMSYRDHIPYAYHQEMIAGRTLY